MPCYCDTALDHLWHDVTGMRPLLSIFPPAISPRDHLPWIPPDAISDEIWARFDRYLNRIRSITLTEHSRTLHSPTIFLRLAEREPFLPTLQKLTVDVAFAAGPSVLLFLSSPLLDKVKITFPYNPEADIASMSIWTVGWKAPGLRSLTLPHPEGYLPMYVELPPPEPMYPFSSFSNLCQLRKLSIKMYSVDFRFLAQLSSFPHLAELKVVVAQSGNPQQRLAQIAFPSLKYLDVAADANRKSDSKSGRIGQFPQVTISSQTEIGQTEESIKVPNQRVYTGRKPIISSSLADTPCSGLGIEGLLDLLNITLGTSYTLDTPSLSFLLKDCIAQNYDFGTAYGRLRSAWHNQRWSVIQMELWEREEKDANWRRNALDGNRIVDSRMKPRRVWDLYSNRVVPYWSSLKRPRPISHAWVCEVDRVDVLTPINGREWPVPIPIGANLDLIRIEMLNLGIEYTWLDVLCLIQRGGPREDLRIEEWKLDVPTIGAIYYGTRVVCYLSGLERPLNFKAGDLDSDCCWFRRAWTVQEVGWERVIAGDTPDGPLHSKPIDEAGNYEDEVLTKFHKQLMSAKSTSNGLYGTLSAMQDRISANPVDKVAGLAFSLKTHSIPAYYESQSLEDAWTSLINEMNPFYRGILLFTYPEPGTGHQWKKWRPSWKQIMTKSLPNITDDLDWIAFVGRDNDDWCEEFHVERGIVRGLAEGSVEGIDRRGELVVEDTDGKAHVFNTLASHQYPIPEDTYTLIGSTPLFSWDGKIRSPQHWVVGQRLPCERFEKVSVFKMTDLDEINHLIALGLSAKSRMILA
ncbi:hypothetical protein F5146DRAFT_1130968 [Armillaria mellea]|nr:hypothetical protein F5146DRAFT_1130968 [Armillaria mellea]